MQVKNISSGARGIWTTGGLVTLEPGEVRDLDLAEGEEAGEWFEFGGAKAKPAKGKKAEPVEEQPEGEIDGA